MEKRRKRKGKIGERSYERKTGKRREGRERGGGRKKRRGEREEEGEKNGEEKKGKRPIMREIV